MGLEPIKPDPSQTPDVEASQAPKFFSITQYNRSVERLLKTVPQVWVKGVITQLRVRGKIAYISLGEFEEGDTSPRAILDVTMWTSQLEVYNLRFSKLPTPLMLRVELKVAFQLEANFYVPSGRFQPRVIGIDENFTLGELSLTRQKTLERLLKEGLLNRNKGLTLSELPLRVGLITAPGSAAYQDFTTVLLQSGFSFRIAFAGAKMQGEATEPTVLAALEKLGGLNLDVICIVRGGGSKTDLVYFDSENICRAIALCPIPVLTGIGHEIDNSLSDLVAYADKITPTDCAKFLEERLTGCYSRLCEYATEISEMWRMECQRNWHEMSERASVVKHAWEGRRAMESQRLATDMKGLLRGPDKLLRLERLRFVNRTQAMGHAWSRFKADNGHRLHTIRMGLKTGWSMARRNCRESLSLKFRLVHAADPARLLGLGFSLLRNQDGKLVRSLAQVPENGILFNQLVDGTVESRVVSKKEKK